MLLAREFKEGGDGAAIVTSASAWTTLYSVAPGRGGFVEVAGYDGFFEARLVGSASMSAHVPILARTQRIGPAGSSCYFAISSAHGATVQVRCVKPIDSGAHCDPDTGIAASGTRAARISAIWTSERPDVETVQRVVVSDTGDMPPVDADSDSASVFPILYARDFSLRAAFLAGEGSVQVIETTATGEEGTNHPLYADAADVSGSLHGSITAWTCLQLRHGGVAGSGDLTGTITLRNRDSR